MNKPSIKIVYQGGRNLHRALRQSRPAMLRIFRARVLGYPKVLLDVEYRIDFGLRNSLRNSRNTARAERTLMRKHRNVLSRLPEGHSWMFVSSNKIHVGYFPNSTTGRDSEAIRGDVQRMMGIPAVRDVNSSNGEVSYVFTTDAFKIEISGGKLAHGCTLEPVEEVVTIFKVVCPDGVEIDG